MMQMSNNLTYLPAQDRVVLAFEDLLARLAGITPDMAAVYPEAVVAATNWTLAGEEPEELAATLTTFFFEALEALAREMREE
jgi:hypothetical protein